MYSSCYHEQKPPRSLYLIVSDYPLLFLLAPIIKPTIDTTHKNFHYVLQEKETQNRDLAINITYITETEWHVLATRALNFSALTSIVLNNIKIRNLSVPIIQVLHTLVII